MSGVPEYINHYLSLLFGLRLITKTDFDHIYKALTTLNSHNYFHYLPYDPETTKRVNKIYEFITPVKAVEAKKVRIGNPNDGGYVCLDHFSNISSAISLGISTDVSWDLEIANRNIDVYQYDHTVIGPPVYNKHFKFNKLKVSPNDGPDSISLDSIVKTNGLSSKSTIFLKMDIEGDEWDTFLSSSSETLDLFDQIVCEFHNFHLLRDDIFYQKIQNVFLKLKEKFEVIHIHGNNCSPLLISPGGRTIPQVMEISFASKVNFIFTKSDEMFPGPLDAPCDPNHADYFIDIPNL